jgi:serine/threonine-protein kinase ULK/ATG1
MKGIKQINNYVLLKEIGKGSTGTVYEANNTLNQKKVAVKSISCKKLENKRLYDNFKRELQLLQRLNHENIIKIVGLEKTVNNTYLILEYCNGGSLFEYLLYHNNVLKTPIPEKNIQFILNQIIRGLEYMHRNKTIHRDIKLENILIHFENFPEGSLDVRNKIDYSKVNIFDCIIKIADLGYARELESSDVATTICGSPMTMAPDVIKAFGEGTEYNYNNKADLWSLGAISYELLTGTLPFYAPNHKNLFEKIMEGKYSFPSKLKISLEAISFVNGLLQFYPERRYDWNQILDHPFIKNDPISFNLIDLEKIEVTDSKKLENNTKDCSNFLWVLFQSSFKDIRLDKIDQTTFYIGEREIFRKLDELKKHQECHIQNEHNYLSTFDKNNGDCLGNLSNEEDLWEIISSSSLEDNLIEFDNFNELNIIENYFA